MNGNGLLVVVVMLIGLWAAAMAVMVWVIGRRNLRSGDRDVLRPRRRVVVNLTDGSALAGLLWERHGSHLLLRDVVVHEREGSTPADGEVVVEAARVLFVQLLPGDGAA